MSITNELKSAGSQQKLTSIFSRKAKEHPSATPKKRRRWARIYAARLAELRASRATVKAS